jgi:hypothetical protein
VSLFDPWTDAPSVAAFLDRHHYLGALRRGTAYQDEFGVIVVSNPTARNLPRDWLELARWCIVSETKNAGSRQWAHFVRACRERFPDATTIVSYSDPSAGHTGALYRACNWHWAPTWHRLRPPPSGNGSWTAGKPQSVKDRWIFPLRPDSCRRYVLRCRDEAILARKPWAEYREGRGADFRQFQREAA